MRLFGAVTVWNVSLSLRLSNRLGIPHFAIVPAFIWQYAEEARLPQLGDPTLPRMFLKSPINLTKYQEAKYEQQSGRTDPEPGF